jgi:hypothetical protein
MEKDHVNRDTVRALSFSRRIFVIGKIKEMIAVVSEKGKSNLCRGSLHCCIPQMAILSRSQDSHRR